MLDVIDWIMKTCGSSLQETLSDRRFETLMKREKSISRIESNSDCGIAYRTGHITMGTLLNCLSEKEAIERASGLDASEHYSLEVRALIHLCGEMIVSKAENCLTDGIRQMAKRWKSSSVDEQILIVRDLFFEFRTESQNSKGELTTESINEGLVRDMSHRQQDRLAYLPGLYKAWNKKDHPANCQGKTQMIIAFAKLAGAKAFVVHPIQHAKEYVTQKCREVKSAIVNDLIGRGLENGSKEFSKALSLSYLDDQIRDMKGECFHVGVILRLTDGRWIMLDPHGLSWGLISDNWDFAKVIKLLNKYRDVLPGLTMIAGNPETSKSVTDELVVRAHYLLERSRRMGERIKREVHSVMDFVDLVSASDDLDLLMRLSAEQNDESVFDLSNPEYRKLAAMMMVLKDPGSLSDLHLMVSPKFLEEKINNWLTFYHCCAMNLFLNREAEEGLHVHPVCEVSASAEWSIAISAINSARFDLRRGFSTTEDEFFFMRHSFNQTSLSNAISLGDRSVSIAAQESLKSLSYLHPICMRKLERIEKGNQL